MRAQPDLILFHPDYTVGSGVTPDLLTLPSLERRASYLTHKGRSIFFDLRIVLSENRVRFSESTML